MRFFVYSHLFIAFCALALTIETFFVFKLPLKNNLLYLVVVFFATSIAYNTKLVYAFFYKPNVSDADKSRWAVRNKIPILIVLGVSLVGIMSAIFFLQPYTLVLLIPLGVLSLGYSFPIVIQGHKIVLREIPFIKTILVAAVWTVVVAYLPFVEASNTVNWIWVLLEFLFLFPLALLFDIKDIDIDVNVITTPSVIGVIGTKALSISILLLRFGLIYYFWDVPFLLLPEAVSTIVSIFCIVYFVKMKASEYFYMVWIDGLMLLKFLTTILHFSIDS